MKPDLYLWRDKNGTPHVEAETRADMYWGQGYVHARDRGVQMLMMRVLGQGRVCELLNDSEESLGVDKFFRQMNWHNNLQSEFDKLSAENQHFMQSYADGVNAAFAEKTPWEFKLLGYKPDVWSPLDAIMISRMIGYLTLAQSQAEMERLFVEMVQAGVSQEKLEELFPGNLGGLDIDLLKQVKLGERIVNPASLWSLAAPRMMASNNWVISGERTASGKPIVANDPHLETNRLPNVWSEIVLSSGGRYSLGGSMPGMPGVLVGRTSDIAWGITYAFVDAVDSWVENCKDGKYYREDGDQWLDFTVRTETIKRKKKDDLIVNFYENEHGTLDGDPHQPGLYLATRWTGATSGAVSVDAFVKLWGVSSAAEGMDTVGVVETGWDFVLADVDGDIGFQMSGAVPKRRAGVSGFVPLPGWKAENDWGVYLSIEEMPRVLNPKYGYFATANHDLNEYGTEHPINMPMGSYRADRINQLLAQNEKFTVAAVFAMHADLFSLQAAYFMDILCPLLPNMPQGEILKNWDLCYDADSQGAFLFEEFYKELYREVFGRNGFGEAALNFLYDETGAFIDFYQNFDRVLLSENSAWFNGQSRAEIYRKVAAQALNVQPKPWGSTRQYTMSHMLFGGTLPGFLGFDRGPITGIGNRATIHQGQIYRSAGRVTTFMPSLRFVTDLAENELHSNLAGGPSDQRFSKWYVSDLDNWLNYRYKITTPDPEQPKLDF